MTGRQERHDTERKAHGHITEMRCLDEIKTSEVK